MNNAYSSLTTNLQIVILAAGASTRLGQPKQLLQWQGKSLLLHAVQTAAEVVPLPLVVLGANAELLRAELQHANAQIVFNAAWRQGIASSIHCGLSTLLKQTPAPQKIIFMVCDQPYVSAGLLNQLIGEHERTGKAIVASSYGNTIGIPALFSKEMFTQLLDLQGDTGAKKIMQRHPGQVASVAFPEGNIDIDTTEEYLELVRKSESPELRKTAP